MSDVMDELLMDDLERRRKESIDVVSAYLVLLTGAKRRIAADKVMLGRMDAICSRLERVQEAFDLLCKWW